MMKRILITNVLIVPIVLIIIINKTQLAITMVMGEEWANEHACTSFGVIGHVEHDIALPNVQ
jgi:hypothetical protein